MSTEVITNDEVLAAARRSWLDGEMFGMATVVGTRGSAPRPLGARMTVDRDGAALGSVSGGCVEGAVYELTQEVIADGTPVLESYGFSDDDAFAVGLTCGGELDIFVERVDARSFPQFGLFLDDITADRPVAVATVIAHPDPARVGMRMLVRPGDPALGERGTLGSDHTDRAAYDDALGLLAAGENAVLTYGPDGERLGSGMQVFVDSHAPRARMLVFGAIDFASAVCSLGSFLGYEVTVCDARPVFATRRRFPAADHLVVEWPHRYLAAERDAGRIDERTAIVVLTHDAKFDVPLLEVALRLPAAYIGAMGSRRTHEDRLSRLAAVGVTPHEIARMHSPIGLDLGGRTPEETALSIAAEITAHRWGGSGNSLNRTRGAIHQPAGHRAVVS
ncbi:XdhC family protein [Nocardioides ultimimeridianus]